MINTTPWSLRIPQHGDTMAAEILDRCGQTVAFFRDWSLAEEVVTKINLWAKGKGIGQPEADLNL